MWVPLQQSALHYIPVSGTFHANASHIGQSLWTHTANTTITIAAESSVPWPNGTEIRVTRGDAFTATIVPAAGVSFLCKDVARTIKDTHSSIYLKKSSTNAWVLEGNLG